MKKNEEAANNWAEICLREILSDHSQYSIHRFIGGMFGILTDNGQQIGEYQGDEKGFYLESKITEKLKPKENKIYERIRRFSKHKKRNIKKEIERRRKLRYNYLIEAIHQSVGDAYVKALESDLALAYKREKNMIAHVKSLRNRASKKTK